MTDCALPLTGSNPQPLVLLAIVAIATGIALLFAVRTRGVRGGATLVIAFALAAAALVVGDSRRADAQECPPATTVAATTTPTTIAETTTTAASTTTAAATTTTTVATTTIAPTPTSTPFPTTPTTAATTTTLAVPDLTPSVDGPQELGLFAQQVALYTVTIENVGTAPTNGNEMTFTVSLPFSSVGNNGALLELAGDPSTPEWTVTEVVGDFGSSGSPGAPTVLTITSTSGFVLAPGATSTLALLLSLRVEDVADFSVDVDLPTGIGGETNAANNTTTYPVSLIDVGLNAPD